MNHEQIIYENYFLVPDGEMCRPVTAVVNNFKKKEDWKTSTMSIRSMDILGEWEVEEKTIRKTEREFDQAFERAWRKKSVWINGRDLYSDFKEELFK